MSILKVCGVVDKKGADISLNAGADLLGFNIWPSSKRYISPERLKKTVDDKIRPLSVILGVDASFEEWERIVKDIAPGYIQLHGDERIEFARKLKENFAEVKLIKRVSVKEIKSFEKVLEYADYILLDSDTPGKGGSGIAFDWTEARGLSEEVRRRLFLAGGINPDNIREALSIGLYGIDTATGSEISPGIKDENKIRLMAREIKKYE